MSHTDKQRLDSLYTLYSDGIVTKSETFSTPITVSPNTTQYTLWSGAPGTYGLLLIIAQITFKNTYGTVECQIGVGGSSPVIAAKNSIVIPPDYKTNEHTIQCSTLASISQGPKLHIIANHTLNGTSATITEYKLLYRQIGK